MYSLTAVKAWYEPKVAPSTNSLFYSCITETRNLLASDVYRVDPFPRDLVLHLSNNLLLILLLSQKDKFWNLLQLNHCHTSTFSDWLDITDRPTSKYWPER